MKNSIALYIRVSTEEQAASPEGSLKNQAERLKNQVEISKLGEVFEVYVDRAKSGKDTKRPALQRMLRDIRDKKVDLVMVSEISRLSRSVKDFTQIWELMNKMGCKFLSLREKFDTTTAAGEMLLMNIASFSQFERRQVSERVSANFLARAKRGLFNGGTIPLGFKKHGSKNGRLEIVDSEAEIVKICFETYLKKETLLGTAKELNRLSITMPRRRSGAGGSIRDGRFTNKNLHSILKNRAYIGIRTYKEDGESFEVPAAWPAIVDEKTFLKTQNIMDRNRKTRIKIQAKGKRYPYILSSLVKCGSCGDSLTGKSAHGKTKKIAYYEHSNAMKRASKIKKCEPFRVQAKILEPLVWKKLVKLMTDPEFSKKIFDKYQAKHKESPLKSEIKALKTQLSQHDLKIKALTEHLSHIPAGVGATSFYEQIREIQTAKETSKNRLRESESGVSGLSETLKFNDFKKFLKKLSSLLESEVSPEVKAKIARLLLAKVEIFSDSVLIYFNLDTSLCETLESSPLTSIKRSPQTTNLQRVEAKNPRPKKNLDEGSFCLTFGGDGET